MAKKASAKSTKKRAKSVKTTARTPRAAVAARRGPAPSTGKYSQAGAPWWKQFLPD